MKGPLNKGVSILNGMAQYMFMGLALHYLVKREYSVEYKL
jgi:hypothetical protein